jgi:predicted component of type VI protein secretion system
VIGVGLIVAPKMGVEGALHALGVASATPATLGTIWQNARSPWTCVERAIQFVGAFAHRALAFALEAHRSMRPGSARSPRGAKSVGGSDPAGAPRSGG